MAKTTKLTVVKNTENIFKLELKNNNVLIDHTAVVSAELRSASGVTVASSITDPSDWDFTNAGYITVKFGLTDLPVKTESYTLIVRDAVNVIGIAWDTQLLITFLP
jgi:hypothetical protein